MNLAVSTTTVVMPVANAPNAVDQHVLPVAAALSLPMHHHAGLRKRKRKKRADGIERDQTVGDAVEENQQPGG